MRNELSYFWVGESYGGSQDRLPSYIMRLGGCAAVAACDSCIYLKLYKNKKALCSLSGNQLKGKEYIEVFNAVKPYLRPRLMGIDRLDIFISGFKNYMDKVGQVGLEVFPWSGENSPEDTREMIRRQIDDGFPIPILLLRHKAPELDFYVWHWFMLTGYDTGQDGRFMVKAVTYGSAEWLELGKLWDTGYERRGGLILYKEKWPTGLIENGQPH